MRARYNQDAPISELLSQIVLLHNVTPLYVEYCFYRVWQESDV